MNRERRGSAEIKGGPSFSPMPLQSEKEGGFREFVQSSWLWILGVIGLLLTVLSAITSLVWPKVNPIWSSIELQFGSSLLAFAVLFYVERRFIIRKVAEATRKVVEELTPERMKKFAEETPDDVAWIADPNGSHINGRAWLALILENRYEDAWKLCEENWQVCRLQAWIYNNRRQLELETTEDFNACLSEMLSGEDAPLWREFFITEKRAFDEIYGPLSKFEWGTSSRRRVVGPGYEVIVCTPLDSSQGFVITGPSILPQSASLLMHNVEGVWLLAALNSEAPPMKGWPPSWWFTDDPVAEEFNKNNL